MPKNVGTDSSVVNSTPTIVFTRLTTLLLLIFSYQALHSQNDIKGKLADARQLSQEGAFEKAALLFKEVADYWQAWGRQDSTFFYRYREASHYSNAYQF